MGLGQIQEAELATELVRLAVGISSLGGAAQRAQRVRAIAERARESRSGLHRAEELDRLVEIAQDSDPMRAAALWGGWERAHTPRLPHRSTGLHPRPVPR